MLCRRIRRFIQIGMFLFLVGAYQGMHPLTISASTNPVVRTQFISITGTSWEKLARGGYGSGYILYYLPGRDSSQPSLVVRMARAKGDPNAIADIYDAPNGKDYVPVSVHSSTVVSSNVTPSIVMTALGGWWVEGGSGIVNYNLTVEINEPMYAMWGEPSYANQLPTNQPLFSIQTRADAKGNPLWDWRTLLPSLPGQGVYHTNYSQRESNIPTTRVPEVSSLFPYVAYEGGFEQPNGSFVPPIVVDWNKGRILDFSEIVTVRHQNASYDFYSLSPMAKGVINKPDFESPWGMYDLSSHGLGYPNLVIRTDHYDPLDPWSTGIDQRFETAPLMDYPTDEIRYSWADHPGNQSFDYKVDVFGFHPYQHVQSIAGKQLKVLAPAYKSYPNWIIDNKWDAITFVDTNGGGYQTSEGIYDWTARDIGNSYWRGWTTTPDLSEFQTIQQGLRGEYEVGISEKPVLYLSPVDNRLHLLQAQGGLWNLGNGLLLEEYNLNQGPFIDAWRVVNKQTVISQFYQESGNLVEGGKGGIRIKTSALPASTLTVVPPTNHVTWLYFSKFASKLRGKTPTSMASWISGGKGSSLLLSQALLKSFSVLSDGFQMVVDIPSTHRVTVATARTLNLPARSGAFVIHYHKSTRRWSARYARPFHPHATVKLDQIHHTVTVQITNTGDQSYDARLTASINKLTYHLSPLHLDTGQTQQVSLPLYPTLLPTDIRISALSTELYHHLFAADDYNRPTVLRLLLLSIPNEKMTLYGLVALLSLMVIGVFRLSYYQSKDDHP